MEFGLCERPRPMRYFSRLIIGFYIKDSATSLVQTVRQPNDAMNMGVKAKKSMFLVVDHLENEEGLRGRERKGKRWQMQTL